MTSKPSKGRTGSQKFPGTFTVRGTIKMCKDGKITVLPGKGPTIKAEVAADATIDVDTTDYRIAQPDDRVTVEGFAKKGQPNMVLAKSIKIELASPLSGAKKKASPHAKTPAAHAPKGKKAPPTPTICWGSEARNNPTLPVLGANRTCGCAGVPRAFCGSCPLIALLDRSGAPAGQLFGDR